MQKLKVGTVLVAFFLLFGVGCFGDRDIPPQPIYTIEQDSFRANYALIGSDLVESRAICFIDSAHFYVQDKHCEAIYKVLEGSAKKEGSTLEFFAYSDCDCDSKIKPFNVIARYDSARVISIEFKNRYLSRETVDQLRRMSGPRYDTDYKEIKPSNVEVYDATDAHVTEYKVRKGDTLRSIAIKYSISYKEIIRKNNLKGETIFPGQILRF